MSLLAPLTAHSLGVGDIKLYSALNEKLNAEIALNLAENEDLADIIITLAAPDKFEKLGIEWSQFLSKVKFQPVVKANGKVVVRLTSDTIVQEPFLDFLVEVSWPKGDIYKEFTVLVDPPVVYQRSNVVAPVVSPTKIKSQTTYTNTPEPINIPEAAQNNFSSLAVEGEFGPVNRTDSLWTVAEKVNKHGDVSIHQMMMALYKANPNAFYKKNVNALMEGKNLKIPQRSEILQLSNKQASAKFNRQMAVWQGKAVAEPDLPTSNEAENSSQLTLKPPTEEEINETGGLTANASNVDSTVLDGLTVENMELQQKLANMENQVAIMQDMIALKDQQFSALQNAKSSATEGLNTELTLEQQAALDKAEAELEQQLNEGEGGIIPDPSIKPPEITDVEVEPEPVEIAPVVQKEPKRAVPDQKEDSGIGSFYTGIGLVSALVIGGLGWVFWSRRQEEDEINDSSMFASSSEIFLPDTGSGGEDELDVPVFDDSTDYGVGTVGESSFLSEFTPSDFDVFESDQAEVDPSSEADVYLAYGRYQQAEELMRQAITETPENENYKLKLLEIFYTSENKEAYEVFANELVAEGKSEDLNFWTKVSEMGKELAPASALFSTDQTESTFELSDDFSTENTVDIKESASIEDPVESKSLEDKVDNISEEVIEEVSNVTENLEESAVDNSALDFDLSDFSLEGNDGETSELKDTVEENIDFDLSSFETIATSGADELIDPESLDTSSDTENETVEFNANEADDINLEDFDFSSGDSDKVQGELELNTSEESKVGVTEEREGGDFDFDETKDGKSGNLEATSEEDLMVSDLTDMDEFETKIDLAKAYIDMGDETSAKDMAQEIIEKGNDDQKQEAQKIIDKLS